MSRTSSSARSTNKTNAILHVEVLQGGAVQAHKQWSMKRLFAKRVTFGSSRKADFFIPFSKLPAQVPALEIRGGKVFVVLDPRTEGFVNTGTEFGDVREYLAPRGAISEIATIDDPLLLELKPGGRGCLRLYGFEIVFHLSLPLPRPSLPLIKGAERGVFCAASADVPFEHSVFWVAGLATALVCLPLLGWLLRAPHEEMKSMTDLPPEIIMELVHPTHFSILPRIYEEEFSGKNATKQAIVWVEELQKRWETAERGETYRSSVGMLQSWSTEPSTIVSAARWRKKAEERYDELERLRKSPDAARYFGFLSAYPRFETTLAGGSFGALNLRISRRLNKLKQTDESLRNLILTEQNFLREYYSGTMTFGKLFEKPTTGNLLGSQPSPDFTEEKSRYDEAERLVQLGNRTWASRQRHQQQSELQAAKWPGDTKIVWLGEKSLILPAVVSDEPERLGAEETDRDAESRLVTNAEYSTDRRQLPPLPPPQARIDRQTVEFVILSRREELKACYDSVLRRNSNLSGTMRWHWVIDERGAAREPKLVGGELTDEALASCIRTRLLNWRFPRPVGGAVGFAYTFQFQSKQATQH